MVMRPKSIATVVVLLAGMPVVSSTAALAAVITASVVNGVISEIAPTMVVLPTPKPPAMRIFADLISDGRPVRLLELPKSTQHPLQQFHPVLVTLMNGRVVQGEQALGDHVGHQHAGYPEGYAHVRRDLRQRQWLAVAHRGDHLLVAARKRGLLAPPRRGHQNRLDGDVARRLGAAPGDSVRADQV